MQARRARGTPGCSVGRALTGIVRVCDENGDELPRGTEGQIFFEPTEGMVRGMTARDTGAPISTPVGREVLGRILNVVGEPVEYFRNANRYRDVVASPDGRRIYLSTDSFGTTADETGVRTSRLGHPGAVLEFTYTGPATPKQKPL